MTPFAAQAIGFVARWEPQVRRVVAALAIDLAALIKVETGLPDHFDDPVARLIDQSTGLGARVSDPAVRRLFPDALDQDPEAAAEFRRLTQNDLAAGQVRGLLALAAAMSGDDDQVVIPRDQAGQIAAALTALRLVLAQRLGLAADADVERLHEEVLAGESTDPGPALFLALGFAQEALVDAMLAELRGGS